MTPKFIISSLVGASVVGGTSVGCYYYFKTKAPESSQSASRDNKKGQTSPITKGIVSDSPQESSLPAATEVNTEPKEVQDSQQTQPAPQNSPIDSGVPGAVSPA